MYIKLYNYYVQNCILDIIIIITCILDYSVCFPELMNPIMHGSENQYTFLKQVRPVKVWITQQPTGKTRLWHLIFTVHILLLHYRASLAIVPD